MQPRTQEVLAHLDAQRALLEQAVAAVPPTLRERQPAAGRWSVAEILEHLTLVEARIASLLGARVAEARAAGLGPERETTPVVPTLDVAPLLDRSRPIEASEASQPRAGLDASAAWAALTEQRRALREMVLAADGLALGAVTIPHPRLGPLNVYQWLVFVGGHEARHVAHVREVAAAVRGA